MEKEENKTQQKEAKKMKKRMSHIKAAEAFSNNSICLGISAAHLSLSIEYVSVIYDAREEKKTTGKIKQMPPREAQTKQKHHRISIYSKISFDAILPWFVSLLANSPKIELFSIRLDGVHFQFRSYCLSLCVCVYSWISALFAS